MYVVSAKYVETNSELALTDIKKRVPYLETMSDNDFIVFIILLNHYLDMSTAKQGHVKSGRYYITSETITKALYGTPWLDYALRIDTLRNYICHRFGTPEMLEVLKEYKSDIPKMRKFLEFLGIK